MILWLIRFLVFFVLFYLVRSLISKFFGQGGARPNRPPKQTKRPPEMRTIGHSAVKDLQCGMYVDKDLAIPAQSEGGTLYFCSERCRDQYLARLRGD
jgi:YHS domain-containing protein